MDSVENAHIRAVPAFIPPSEPVEQQSPPTGLGLFHEVCFTGDRLQLHKRGGRVVIYGRTGRDMTARFRALAEAAAALPCASCVIDATGVAGDAEGPVKPGARVAWCFDLLEYDGDDMRELPLLFRRAKLAGLLRQAGSAVLRYSETFADPDRLLAAVKAQGLPGIVSKLGMQPYVSGSNPGWTMIRWGA